MYIKMCGIAKGQNGNKKLWLECKKEQTEAVFVRKSTAAADQMESARLH